MRCGLETSNARTASQSAMKERCQKDQFIPMARPRGEGVCSGFVAPILSSPLSVTNS